MIRRMMAFVLTIVVLMVSCMAAAVEFDSEEMKQLMLQMLGIDEDTANSMPPDELQALINQTFGLEDSEATEEKSSNEKQTVSFDEKVFSNAGYSISEDVFTGQKVISLPDSNVTYLTYSTKLKFAGMTADTHIFGKDVKEEGELPVWTEGDNSEFHDKQKTTKFYPCIVYNANHDVPYTFVVSLSFPKLGKNSWLSTQPPYGVAIATEKKVYTLNKYLPVSTSFYMGTIFVAVDEQLMQMFSDIATSKTTTVRLTSFDAKKEEVSLTPDCIEGILEAWELYKQAGGMEQDLSSCSNAVETKER